MTGTETFTGDKVAGHFTSLKTGHRTLSFGEATVPSNPGAFGTPGEGKVYYGQTIGPGVNLASRETGYTTRISVYHDYFNLGSTGTTNRNDLIAFCIAQINAGRVPVASFKLNGTSVGVTGSGPSGRIMWQDAADGLLDTIFNNIISAINAGTGGKGPVILAPHSEPNGDEGTDGPTKAAYKAMCSHFMSLKTASPNILLVPILAGGYSNVAQSGLQFADWMSATSCDLFGFNTYSHISWSPANGKQNLTIPQVLGLQVAQMSAIDPTKQWLVGEWGRRTNPTVAGQAATWMTDFLNYAIAQGAYAICYFDSNANVNDGGSPWTLDDTTDGTSGVERLARYKRDLLDTTKVAKIPLGGLSS